jgi:hypothetical protein
MFGALTEVMRHDRQRMRTREYDVPLSAYLSCHIAFISLALVILLAYLSIHPVCVFPFLIPHFPLRASGKARLVSNFSLGRKLVEDWACLVGWVRC